MNNQAEISFSLPDIEDLICIVCRVNAFDIKTSIVKSLFHLQVLTCRLVVKTARPCIGAPISNIKDAFRIIVSKEFYARGKLQGIFESLSLPNHQIEELTEKIYIECLRYTFTFKLAPYWNLAGRKYFIKGFDFLLRSDSLDAVDCNIVMKRDGPKLLITPLKMNLYPLTLKNLPIPQQISDNFINNPYSSISSIDLKLFGTIYAHVLPSLKKARLLSVSKSLPKTCPFDTYEEFRSHWKNMYSYRLPKTDVGILYYEVIFPPFNDEHFIYPDICLKTKTPEFITCINPDEIALQFLQELTLSVRSVCGKTIKFHQDASEFVIKYSETKSIDMMQNWTGQSSKNSVISPHPTPIYIPVNHKPNLSSMFSYKGKKKIENSLENKLTLISQSNNEKDIVSDTSRILSYEDVMNIGTDVDDIYSLNDLEEDETRFDEDPLKDCNSNYSDNHLEVYNNNNSNLNNNEYSIEEQNPMRQDSLASHDENEYSLHFSSTDTSQTQSLYKNNSLARNANVEKVQLPNKPRIKNVEVVQVRFENIPHAHKFNAKNFDSPHPNHINPQLKNNIIEAESNFSREFLHNDLENNNLEKTIVSKDSQIFVNKRNHGKIVSPSTITSENRRYNFRNNNMNKRVKYNTTNDNEERTSQSTDSSQTQSALSELHWEKEELACFKVPHDPDSSDKNLSTDILQRFKKIGQKSKLGIIPEFSSYFQDSQKCSLKKTLSREDNYEVESMDLNASPVHAPMLWTRPQNYNANSIANQYSGQTATIQTTVRKIGNYNPDSLLKSAQFKKEKVGSLSDAYYEKLKNYNQKNIYDQSQSSMFGSDTEDITDGSNPLNKSESTNCEFYKAACEESLTL